MTIQTSGADTPTAGAAHPDQDGLFPAPPRQTKTSAPARDLTVLAEKYDGLPFWALAPTNRRLRKQHWKRPTEAVWLVVGHRRAVWALVDLHTQTVLVYGQQALLSVGAD